jgi:tetratricopeptide (TPR) repeat protein
MKRLWILTVCCLPLTGLAQEGEKYDPKALRASEELTREANEELAENDFVDAEANYRRAISKSVENPVAPYNLGNAYYNKESYGEAFGSFKEAGERAAEKQQKHKAFHNMGNVYMKQKDYQKAVEAYKEALRNDPADEETRYNLALAKELLKKDQEQQKNNEDNEDEQKQDDQENKEEQNQDQNEGDGQDNQEDQENQQDGDSEKEDNKEGDGDKKQEQDRKPEEKDQPQQPRPNQLSPQQIQNLLQAMENEEKKVKEKLDAQKVKGAQVKTEKDW